MNDGTADDMHILVNYDGEVLQINVEVLTRAILDLLRQDLPLSSFGESIAVYFGDIHVGENDTFQTLGVENGATLSVCSMSDDNITKKQWEEFMRQKREEKEFQNEWPALLACIQATETEFNEADSCKERLKCRGRLNGILRVFFASCSPGPRYSSSNGHVQMKARIVGISPGDERAKLIAKILPQAWWSGTFGNTRRGNSTNCHRSGDVLQALDSDPQITCASKHSRQLNTSQQRVDYYYQTPYDIVNWLKTKLKLKHLSIYGAFVYLAHLVSCMQGRYFDQFGSLVTWSPAAAREGIQRFPFFHELGFTATRQGIQSLCCHKQDEHGQTLCSRAVKRFPNNLVLWTLIRLLVKLQLADLRHS